MDGPSVEPRHPPPEPERRWTGAGTVRRQLERRRGGPLGAGRTAGRPSSPASFPEIDRDRAEARWHGAADLTAPRSHPRPLSGGLVRYLASDPRCAATAERAPGGRGWASPPSDPRTVGTPAGAVGVRWVG